MLILYLSLREGQTYNVVIIAKRIHLFPYRTQKLSSLAAMVLGGRPPGRVARSHVVCRSGGTGRRTGLKILRDLYSRTGSIPVFGTIFQWTISSVGQSARLITGRSGVRVPDGPPNKYLISTSRCSAVWQRTWFGTMGPGVRVPSPRPKYGGYSSVGQSARLWLWRP